MRFFSLSFLEGETHGPSLRLRPVREPCPACAFAWERCGRGVTMGAFGKDPRPPDPHRSQGGARLVEARLPFFSPVHQLWILDVVDVLLVAILFYRLLVLVRGTRAAQMFVLLVVLVFLSFLARCFSLCTVAYIATSLRTVWLITFVILFQPELRHVLSEFGRTRYFRSLLRVNEYGTIGEVVRAAEELAERRHGGLIVIERNQGLRNFVETGTRLDARATPELMVTLFHPGSPLHAPP